jgi:hypothetical protein
MYGYSWYVERQADFLPPIATNAVPPDRRYPLFVLTELVDPISSPASHDWCLSALERLLCSASAL